MLALKKIKSRDFADKTCILTKRSQSHQKWSKLNAMRGNQIIRLCRAARRMRRSRRSKGQSAGAVHLPYLLYVFLARIILVRKFFC